MRASPEPLSPRLTAVAHRQLDRPTATQVGGEPFVDARLDPARLNALERVNGPALGGPPLQ